MQRESKEVSSGQPLLVLLEPVILDQLTDRPHLGCAMLVAACRSAGCDVHLIAGQTRWMRGLMCGDAREVWDLIHAADAKTLAPHNLSSYRQALAGRSCEDWSAELSNLYAELVGSGSPRALFNGTRVEKLRHLYRGLARFVADQACELGPEAVGVARRVLEEVRALQPSAVGFSLHGGFDPLSRLLRRRLRSELGLPVIVGGSNTPFISVEDYPLVLQEEVIDYLVVGPGEHALPALLHAIEAGERPEGVAGVYWMEDEEVQGHAPEVIDDLDSLPTPDYRQFELDRYLTPRLVLGIETARGCSWSRCAFCAHHSGLKKTYRTWSVDRVVNEMAELRDTYGCEHFALHDLEMPPRRAAALSDAIQRVGLDGISLTAFGRLVRGYTQDELWRRMRRAGFASYEWGVESGCQRVLDSMDKGTKVEVGARVLEVAARHGVANQCFLLFGFPGETVADAEETLAWVRRHRHVIARLTISALTVQPHSPLGDEPSRWGMRLVDGEWESAGGMTNREVANLCRRVKADYHLNHDRYTSSPVQCISHGNLGRLMYALCVAYGLLTPDTARSMLDAGEWSTLYPMLVGHVMQEEDGVFWQPIDVNESPLASMLCRPAKRRISALERIAWQCLDGRPSLLTVGTELARDAEEQESGGGVMEAVGSFVRESIVSGRALVFSRSWATTYSTPGHVWVSDHARPGFLRNPDGD